jgi:hypothetical protein
MCRIHAGECGSSNNNITLPRGGAGQMLVHAWRAQYALFFLKEGERKLREKNVFAGSCSQPRSQGLAGMLKTLFARTRARAQDAAATVIQTEYRRQLLRRQNRVLMRVELLRRYAEEYRLSREGKVDVDTLAIERALKLGDM